MSLRSDKRHPLFSEGRWRAAGEYEAWLEGELVRARQEIQQLSERVSRGDIEWITDSECAPFPSKSWQRPPMARTLTRVQKDYGWLMSLETARKLVRLEFSEARRSHIRSDVNPALVPALSRWARTQ